MKRNMASGQGVMYSIFGGGKLTQNDVNAITNYANAMKGGANSAQAWSTGMNGASVAAKQYVLSARKAGKSTDEMVAGLKQIPKATTAASVGFKLLSVAGNMLITMGISMAISGIIKGIDNLIHAEEKAAEKAREVADSSRETARAHEEEREQLNTLIERYEELAQSENFDSQTRNEIKKIQEDIVGLVGDEAKGIDLVNGNLDDQIAKLREINAIKAGETVSDYEKAYKDATDETKNAVKRQGNWADNLTNSSLGNDNVITFDFFGDDKARNKGLEIIDKVWKEKGYGSAYVDEVRMDLLGLVWDSFSKLELNKDLNDTEKAEAIQAAVEALEKAEGYDYNDSELWKELVEIRNSMTGQDGTVTKQKNAANNLLDAILVQTVSSGKDVSSAEEYQKYIDEIVKIISENETVKDAIENEDLKLEDVNSVVTYYLGNMKKYSDYTKDAIVGNHDKMTVSLSDLMGVAGGLETLGKAFKEMSDDGHISLDTLSKIKNTFAGSVDDIDSYVDRLMKTKAGSKEFTSALTDLTYGYINQKMSIEQLADADETYIATLLKEVGVSNSVQVAQHMIAVAKEKLRLETEGVSFATADEINELMNEAGASNATKQAIIELAREKVELSAKKIDSSDDIEQLMATAKAAGIAAESYAALAKLKASGIADMTSEQRANTRLTPEQTRALEAYEKLKNGEFEFGWENTDLYTYTPKVQYTGGSSNSSSDKNEDPTDAIINRINLRSKELEQQEEQIENAIEIAELENDHKKQISLTNDLIANRKKRVQELTLANSKLSKAAWEIKDNNPWDEDSWFDSQGNATEAYFSDLNRKGITKEEQKVIKDLFEKLSKYYKAYMDNAEEIAGINKQILKDEKEILDLRGEYFNKATDFHSSYFDSRISILKAQYELENSIAEARHELNKELETSKTMYEYLDEETRELLFNQEDYNKLSEKLLSIEKRGDRLQSQYKKDLENATLETVEEITANYERQYETLMKSYEIAKADLEIAKKKQQLNNVLNERKVRMFLNGQWQWVADTEEVARAKSELADAEYAKRVAKAGLKQQESINNLTLQQDQLGIVVKKFENGVITLDEAIIDAAGAIDKLPKALQEMYQNASKGNTSSSSNPFGTGNSSPSGASGGSTYTSNLSKEYVSWAKAQMAENSKNWHTADANGKKALEAANQTLGAEIGSTYDEASGTWKHQYATGSKYTKDGLSLLGEAGSEVYITSNGRLIPINQPTIGNIPSGGVVFNQDQMRGLRTLWDMSNLNLNPDRAHIERQPQQIDQSHDNRIIINGMTVDSGSSDGQALISALRRYVSNH